MEKEKGKKKNYKDRKWTKEINQTNYTTKYLFTKSTVPQFV